MSVIVERHVVAGQQTHSWEQHSIDGKVHCRRFHFAVSSVSFAFSIMATIKFKALCLHGYRQDGAAMRAKIGGLRKALKKVEWVFLDAANLASTSETATDPSTERSWYNNIDNGTGFAYDSAEEPTGFEASVKAVDDIIAAQGPFDVLISFSQGACFAQLYLAQKAEQGPLPFKAAIFCAGFIAQAPSLLPLASKELSIPSLFIHSENDQIIPAAATIAQSKKFSGSATCLHTGGHGFPSASILKPALVEFSTANGLTA
uniref:FSH1 domain-containing protein n=1 Tax=Panagrellus redivivus TaxID=6233 RepID=A0A7E4V9M8_PANRE